MLALDVAPVAAQVLACAFERETFVLYQKADDAQLLDVIGRVQARPAGIAPRTQLGEFLLPEAERALRQVQEDGYVAYAVEFL